MDKEITLALLTPRSGALNYRYLIPEGVSYNDMKLGEIRNQLERSEKDRPGALLQCEARQLGGRMGTEALIFHVSEFQHYPQDEQNRCRKLLQDWFDNKRDAIIQAIDWSAHPNTQTIAIPELTQLKNQLSAILSKPIKIDSTSSVISTGIISFFKHLFLIMIALTLTILLISAPGIQIGEVFKKIHNIWHGESSVQEQEQALLLNLAPYKELFLFPTEPTKSSDYKDAFNDLYSYCDRKPKNSVEEYLKDVDVQNIKNQKQANQLLVFGRVPETRMLNNVKGISPVQLRRILAAYKKMQNTVFNETQDSVFTSMFNNEKFKIDALMKEHTDILLNDSKKKAQPKFFVQADSVKELEWANKVHDFIFSIIEDKCGKDEIASDMSQKPLLKLIQTKSFNNSFNNVTCESDEFRAAFNEFYSGLKEIAEESKK